MWRAFVSVLRTSVDLFAPDNALCRACAVRLHASARPRDAARYAGAAFFRICCAARQGLARPAEPVRERTLCRQNSGAAAPRRHLLRAAGQHHSQRAATRPRGVGTRP